MQLDIRETLLNDPEESQLDIRLHPSEMRRHLKLNVDSSSVREAARVMTDCIL